MKKSAIAVFLMVVLTVTSVFANASLPSFFTDIPVNYTENCSVSVTFDSSDDLIALLYELDIPEEVENFVDMQSLIKSLLTYDGKLFLQADMSENFDKIKMSLTSESVHGITVNQNARLDASLKMGLWLNIDLSDEKNPIFDMILSYPMFNKYLKITSEDIFADENAFEALKFVFSKEYMDYIQNLSVTELANYATLSGSGNEYTMRLDNDGLCAYIDKIMIDMPQLMSAFGSDEADYFSYPSVKGWKLLGDGGMECVYKLKGGRISAETVKIDVSADISDIYTAVTGEEWEYEAHGILDFTVDINADISKYGSTKVDFPLLTAENSMSLSDFIPTYEDDDFTFAEYPIWYLYGESEKLPVIDGKLYVPLREVLEQAYEDEVLISYNNGAVTAHCKYFPGYSELVAVIDSPIAYADGAQHTVAAPIAMDGTVYVNGDFLADMLGFGLSGAVYDYINNMYTYEIFTSF